MGRIRDLRLSKQAELTTAQAVPPKDRKMMAGALVCGYFKVYFIDQNVQYNYKLCIISKINYLFKRTFIEGVADAL